MLPRFITKTIHAYLDYPVAISLVAMPFILGLGSVNPLAFWLSVATGIAAFVLTVLTDHHLGIIRVLPYKLHLTVDFLVGLVFVAAPFALGLAGLEAAYYWVLGGTVLAVVSLHKQEDTLQTA
ncbi:SPW repeat domain-containing protein [Anderseniella sp. Alg231-50]|uniref:SPW repeat domain-containing protein n=1 Tax=Anderseniella sp. Alg231-50 TaxID=1922226 RepID=UPI000D55DF0B